MEHEPIQITCRNCKQIYLIKTIVMHAKYNSECKHTYSPLHITSLKSHSKQVSAAKKKLKDAERHLRNKEEAARKYQEKRLKSLKSTKKKRLKLLKSMIQ